MAKQSFLGSLREIKDKIEKDMNIKINNFEKF